MINSIEKTYAPIDLNQLNNTETYYIHVLGAGASLDSRLPASMKLHTSTLIRLVEGIRIYNHLEHGALVTSASAKKGFTSQAEISKETAVSLGVNEEGIKMLETPTTTLEEAIAFKEKFGKEKKVILVTSALHLPRAVEIFKDQGLNVTPAPSGYIYKEGPSEYNGITFPSLKSIELMNMYHRAKLKEWYYSFNK